MTSRHTFLLLCLSCIACMTGIGLNSCDKSEDGPNGDASVTVIAGAEEVDAVKGAAEIKLRIDGFKDMKYLKIEKETSFGKLPANYQKSILSEEFTYEYQLKQTDPELIYINFTGYDLSGAAGPTTTVKIHNKEGVSGKSVTFTNLQCISRVTGKEENGHDGLPAVKYSVGNRTDLKYNVGGTDLGIVWEIEPGRYGLFFGDTYGADFKPNFAAPGPNGGSWRCNVVLFSEDTDLSNGLRIDDAATDGKQAKEICFGAKNTSGTGDWTSIPTAAVHANGAEYVHYMNIKAWNGWVTNYSGMYKSTDKGMNWERVGTVNFAGESNFGQAGYYNDNGTVYMIATKTGRSDTPHIARFRESDIEDPAKYEYWNGIGWIKGREDLAVPMFKDETGELSFSYMPELGKWILLYFNGPRYEISMRSADRPEGPWSDPVQVASGWQWAQLYGSFIHPLSKNGTTLYFIMSMWLPYNTYLMSIDLKSSK